MISKYVSMGCVAGAALFLTAFTSPASAAPGGQGPDAGKFLCSRTADAVFDAFVAEAHKKACFAGMKKAGAEVAVCNAVKVQTPDADGVQIEGASKPALACTKCESVDLAECGVSASQTVTYTLDLTAEYSSWLGKVGGNATAKVTMTADGSFEDPKPHKANLEEADDNSDKSAAADLAVVVANMGFKYTGTQTLGVDVALGSEASGGVSKESITAKLTVNAQCTNKATFTTWARAKRWTNTCNVAGDGLAVDDVPVAQRTPAVCPPKSPPGG